jgi:serine/threonine-protein kinase HipA
MVFVELLTMRIAQSVLGADRVPATDLWRNCYRVRRFDRPRTNEGVMRLHQEDFCLALGRMPDQKYETASPRESLLAPCFQLIDELGARGLIKSPALERGALLDQVILNVLLHNPDAHLKNYAFVFQEGGTLEISPLYDCLCTHDLRFEGSEASPWDESTGPEAHTRALSMRVGSATQIDEVCLADWEAFADECGFTPAFVRRRVRLVAEQVREVVRSAADAVVEEVPAAEQAAAGVVEGVLRQLEAAGRAS